MWANFGKTEDKGVPESMENGRNPSWAPAYTEANAPQSLVKR